MCVCCECDGDAGVGSGGGVVAVNAYMGVTRGSSVLSSDMLEMSVVRGVGGVCDMCMCLARGGVGEVGSGWVIGLGQGLGGWCVLMSVCVVRMDSLSR